MNSILLVSLAACIGFIVRGFFGEYTGQKGKNLATKEDIAEITRRTERVRSEISSQSAFGSELRRNQQTALLAFYDVAIELLHQRFIVNFGDFPMDQGKSLFAYQQVLNKNIVELLRTYQRLVVFLGNESDLSNHAHHMVKGAIKAHGAIKGNFGTLKTTALNEELAYRPDGEPEYELAAAKANKANAEFWGAVTPFVTEYTEASEKFIGELASFIRETGKGASAA